MFRFYAVPAWQLIDDKTKKAAPAQKEEELKPTTDDPEYTAAALARVEYRGFKAAERAKELLQTGTPAVYARSPNDLPALLRTADQLLTMAKVDAGERAQLFRCSCGTRYAVPVSLMRPVSLKCERCGNVVEIDASHSIGESTIADPKTAGINQARVALSEFFREAMARGWPVLVAKS